MNYLLAGGEFNNKGAEAMTLIAMSHICKNDSEAKIYMFGTGYKQPFEMKKDITYIINTKWWLRERMGRRPVCCYKARFIDLIKLFWPGKVSSLGKKKKSEQILRNIDVVIDISGFAFSSKWGDDGAIEWLDQLGLMQTYGAKVYIMPQSFGPFDFISPDIVNYGKKVLSKCEYIYAREKKGYELLKGLGLTNVEYMPDSVLIEKDFDSSLVIKDIEKYREEFNYKTDHNFCIIPNYRLIDQGGMDKNKLINFYTDLVERYKSSFDIYLVAHAGEDLGICKAMKEKYKENDRVILINHIMNSFNYEEFIKRMDFIIASRYHAIIHAYKEYVPAVILGWADKYQGVAEEMKQTEYIISIDDVKTALRKTDMMVERYVVEKEIIKRNVTEIQKKDCYAFLKDLHEIR